MIKRNLNKVIENIKNALNNQAGLTKIDELCGASNTVIAQVEATLEQFKQKVITSFGEFDGTSFNFSKDSQFLRENLDQIRAQIKSILKDAKVETKTQTRGDEDFLFKTMKSLMVTEQLLEETSTYDLKKNKIFISCKEEFSTLCNKAKSYIKELGAQTEKLRTNNQVVLSIIRDDKKTNGQGKKAGEEKEGRRSRYLKLDIF